MSGHGDTIFVCPLCRRTSVVPRSLHGHDWDCRECGCAVRVLIPGLPRPAFLPASSDAIDAASHVSPRLLVDDHEPRKPFTIRLAGYLHVTEEQLAGRKAADAASRMFLYSAAPVGSGRPPRTRRHIRQILERIRRLVHGGALDNILAMRWPMPLKKQKAKTSTRGPS